MVADEAAMGLDLDLQDGGVRGAADRGEGAAAALATALRGGEFVFFGDGAAKIERPELPHPRRNIGKRVI